jgi:hypothetical protein
MGKSTTAGAPFGSIDRLARGDVIRVLTGEGRFTYVVVDRRTGASRPPVLKTRSVLTLITGNLTWSSGGTAPAAGLVYVDATLRGAVKGAPRGRPRSVPVGEQPGSNDPYALPLVLLWFVVLLAAVGASWWLWARWGLARTWLIGAPVLFAVLWVMGSEVMRFLPNVY